MQSFLPLAASVAMLAAFVAHADIVGSDDRIEVRHASKAVEKLARSVALHTTKSKIIELKGGELMLLRSTVAREYNYCDDVRFAEQGVGGDCTATLVGPKEVLLAAHCIQEKEPEGFLDLRARCDTSAFLFDFRADNDGKEPENVAKRNVYECKSMKRFRTEPATGRTALKDDGKRIDDYVFVTLDRPVEGATPLRLPQDEAEELAFLKDRRRDKVVIHHPFGVVQKVSPVVEIETTESNLVRTDADVSRGSSGSPLVDVASGTVLGVMMGVTYPKDHLEKGRDTKLRCHREHVFAADERPSLAVRATTGVDLREERLKPKPRQD